MVRTRPSEPITTPVPSRCGPRLRLERALEIALLFTLTTESASTVSSGLPCPAAGGVGGVGADEPPSCATDAALNTTTAAAAKPASARNQEMPPSGRLVE